MLRKLLKHEFIATGRMMWIIYVAVLVLSVGANISMRALAHMNVKVLNAISIVILVMWGLSLVGSAVATLVLMVRRFQKNLLTDEGYLMFTLPGNVHQLVIAKMLVAAVWYLVTFLVIALGILIAVFDNYTLVNLAGLAREAFLFVNGTMALNAVAILVELLVLAFVSAAASMLEFYSAMSIGHGFASHKGLWSVVFFFVQHTAIQIISWVVLLGVGMSRIEIGLDHFFASVEPMTGVHTTMLVALAADLILGAVFYGLTVLNLKKRLNLA